MTMIRKFAYATLLALTTLSLVPSLASAQEPARGKFTLTHDVHWANAVVPAGDYQFTLDSNGIAGVLILNKLNGDPKGFFLMVHDTEEAKSSDLSRLLLQTTPDGSYVSAMQLPDFGMTLHFTVPSATAEKQIARAVTAPPASAQ